MVCGDDLPTQSLRHLQLDVRPDIRRSEVLLPNLQTQATALRAQRNLTQSLRWLRCRVHSQDERHPVLLR